MAGGPLLLGVDAGTSRIRAIAFEPDGRVAAEGSAPTPTRQPGPGQGEHDAEELWRAAVTAIRGALAGIDDPARVRSVAVASVGEAGIVLDGGGRPLFPVLAWYDARPGAELRPLLDRLGAERLHAITGLRADPTFTLLKLLWHRASEPDAFAAASAWLSVSGWIAWRLCGERAVDYSLASRTLLLDLAAADWSDEILDATGLDRSLPGPIAPSGTRVGAVTAEGSAATGLTQGCAVGVGGYDHVCGLLAAGAEAPGVLLNSLGTAESLILATTGPSRDRALFEAGINQGLMGTGAPIPFMGGGVPTASACIEWFRSLWPDADYSTLIAEAEAVPAGAHEAMFLPHLRIGSPPFPDPVARAGFVGVSDACTRGVLFRALIEGLALDAANQLRLMREHSAGAGTLDRVVAIGGGTRNRLLMRLKAALYGLPVEVTAMPEATCLGAALLGGVAAGLFPDLAAARAGLVAEWRRVEPDEAGWPEKARERRLAAYAEAYALNRRINALLRPEN